MAPVLELSLRQSTLRKPSEIAQELHIEVWNDAAIREAIQTEKGPLYVATTYGTETGGDGHPSVPCRPAGHRPVGVRRGQPAGCERTLRAGLPAPLASLAQEIAGQLADSQCPLVMSGVHCGTHAVLQAAANVAYALHRKNPRTRICFTVPWCNSMGLGLIGGKRIEQAVEALRIKGPTTVIILENDLYRYLDMADADSLLRIANHVVAIDCLENRTTAKSSFVLPAGTFAESTGTLVNNEGRAQRFYPGV